jgi:hypothetical protein
VIAADSGSFRLRATVLDSIVHGTAIQDRSLIGSSQTSDRKNPGISRTMPRRKIQATADSFAITGVDLVLPLTRGSWVARMRKHKAIQRYPRHPKHFTHQCSVLGATMHQFDGLVISARPLRREKNRMACRSVPADNSRSNAAAQTRLSARIIAGKRLHDTYFPRHPSSRRSRSTPTADRPASALA